MTSQNLDEIGTSLQTLAKYEIDSSFIIGQAAVSIRNADLSDDLVKAKEECEQNIEVLSNLIRQLGNEPPEHTRDFKGFFMQGYVGMRGLMSDKGAMQALHTNIRMVLKQYENILHQELPQETKDKLQDIYKKAKEHADYIASHSS